MGGFISETSNWDSNVPSIDVSENVSGSPTGTGLPDTGAPNVQAAAINHRLNWLKDNYLPLFGGIMSGTLDGSSETIKAGTLEIHSVKKVNASFTPDGGFSKISSTIKSSSLRWTGAFTTANTPKTVKLATLSLSNQEAIAVKLDLGYTIDTGAGFRGDYHCYGTMIMDTANYSALSLVDDFLSGDRPAHGGYKPNPGGSDICIFLDGSDGNLYLRFYNPTYDTENIQVFFEVKDLGL